jgi:hypothetical protein
MNGTSSSRFRRRPVWGGRREIFVSREQRLDLTKLLGLDQHPDAVHDHVAALELSSLAPQ